MAEWLLALLRRREELERGVFSHPPSDWAEFQRRMGMYQELTFQIDSLTDTKSRKEDDNES